MKKVGIFLLVFGFSFCVSKAKTHEFIEYEFLPYHILDSIMLEVYKSEIILEEYNCYIDFFDTDDFLNLVIADNLVNDKEYLLVFTIQPKSDLDLGQRYYDNYGYCEYNGLNIFVDIRIPCISKKMYLDFIPQNYQNIEFLFDFKPFNYLGKSQIITLHSPDDFDFKPYEQDEPEFWFKIEHNKVSFLGRIF